MAKFHGTLGYIKTEETSPGVYTDAVTEKSCTGDILRNSQQLQSGDKINDDLTINNTFSVIADETIYRNFIYLRYLVWNGVKWKIKTAEFRRPRIILTVGDKYNV